MQCFNVKGNEIPRTVGLCIRDNIIAMSYSRQIATSCNFLGLDPLVAIFPN
jgi:hypothetical protein